MDPFPSSSDPAPLPGRPGSGITCRHVYEGSVLTLWGEVDAQLREAASQAMASLASRPDPAPVVVEARDVTFIDSSGIAFILQVFVLGEETGSAVTLREPSAEVMRVLEMVGLAGRLNVEAARATA
ncbi:STAS domain-containing protein [Myceligenerans crystallogenes]|uniref:STAS domain-containing protein n=1 Tax=Myceligenerans crystallogenes TaxID=316335 RepID=A0ABP4ZQL6_9MICO